ncbi:50S ribosomal protein L23 [Allohahella sp. A8]|uniref:50S ribosomal protein L23 n=1 Tax=Allohahella sp. A8 TaxID=3141461 RepID=UPI000C0B8AB2|nr:50S ribosomal protein L23 [Hahellaceae bacterium]|tara:strand:- start:28271 stop:28567 length:297 start_codon:yes stop_codon:yes gene_type:complete
MIRERLYKVLLGPHVSEKATRIAELNNQVTFKIAPDATKAEVRQAVEALFKVSVKAVQVVTIKGKTKRTARGIGKKSAVRKAYVRLAEGQTIEFADVE